MTALVEWDEWNGAVGSESATDKTGGTIRFKTADNAIVDTNDGVQRPPTGRNYSREKWIRTRIQSGTFNEISNIRFGTDGANSLGTGLDIWVAKDATYSTPVVPSNADDPPKHDAVAMVNAFSYTQGVPLTLGAGPYDSTGLPKSVGDFLVLVGEVDSTAGTGSSAVENINFYWDET